MFCTSFYGANTERDLRIFNNTIILNASLIFTNCTTHDSRPISCYCSLSIPEPTHPHQNRPKKRRRKKRKLEIGLHLPRYEVEDTLNCPVYNEWIYWWIILRINSKKFTPNISNFLLRLCNYCSRGDQMSSTNKIFNFVSNW